MLAGLDKLGLGAFDDAIVLGCLLVACARLRGSLERALANVARVVRKGGRVLCSSRSIAHPCSSACSISGSRSGWRARTRAGLSLLRAPTAWASCPCASSSACATCPAPLVSLAFHGGERLLDDAPWLAPLADYKLLLFTRAGAATA